MTTTFRGKPVGEYTLEELTVPNPAPPLEETVSIRKRDLHDLLRACSIGRQTAYTYETEKQLPSVAHVAMWRTYMERVETAVRDQAAAAFIE